ncbi:endonuclease domain-containing protein [Parabacteroides sp. W1-Q-101]|uniref:endonuclease domain-containing protein n=1 Tax=Parabacteroides TaxID=375288 RepID=UPI001F1F066C|nr:MULTISPECIES: endonuclease domain-containing protein [Parabacteroides]MCM0721187.1 endonuclease domain-containing protein [Parabacteroides sp. W1-Q-101]
MKFDFLPKGIVFSPGRAFSYKKTTVFTEMGKYTISILATAYFSPLSALILKHTGEEVVAEYRFHPGRDWRFDFAIPSRRVAVEVEGGAFNGGRHIRPEGYLRDMEKYNEAAVSGWCVIRVLPGELLMLKTLRLVIRAVQNHN